MHEYRRGGAEDGLAKASLSDARGGLPEASPLKETRGI